MPDQPLHAQTSIPAAGFAAMYAYLQAKKQEYRLPDSAIHQFTTLAG